MHHLHVARTPVLVRTQLTDAIATAEDEAGGNAAARDSSTNCTPSSTPKAQQSGRGKPGRKRKPATAVTSVSRKRATPDPAGAEDDNRAAAEADERPVRPRRNAARGARAAISAVAAASAAGTAQSSDFFLPVAVKKQKVRPLHLAERTSAGISADGRMHFHRLIAVQMSYSHQPVAPSSEAKRSGLTHFIHQALGPRLVSFPFPDRLIAYSDSASRDNG